MKVFMAMIAPSADANVCVSKEFMKYRCGVNREDVRRAVDRTGQTNLKKWFGKSQQSG
jgi:origin recognition complex subunit 4